jgi:hypothetical protein
MHLQLSQYAEGLFDTDDGLFDFTLFDAAVDELGPFAAFSEQLVSGTDARFHAYVDFVLNDSDDVTMPLLEQDVLDYVQLLRNHRNAVPDDLVAGPDEKAIAVVYGNPKNSAAVAEAVGDLLEEKHRESKRQLHEAIDEDFLLDAEKVWTKKDGLIQQVEEDDLDDENEDDLTVTPPNDMIDPKFSYDALESGIVERRDRKNVPFDVVQRPKHYNEHVSGVECIDIAELMTFNAGNAFKYVYRRGSKGNEKQDLEKARWYAVREIQRLDRLLANVPIYILRKYQSNFAFTEGDVQKAQLIANTEPDDIVQAIYDSLFERMPVDVYKAELQTVVTNLNLLVAEL